MVVFETNKGSFTVELNAEKAPVTVENFKNYVKKGHYDGTIFHRIIPGFMVQGGGFEPGMKQKESDAQIKNEANNGLSNVVGSLAMARTNEPHSASNQFFININDNSFLDFKSETDQGWGYAVFAKIADGMEVVDAIKGVDTGDSGFHKDVPLQDVVIEKAYIKED